MLAIQVRQLLKCSKACAVDQQMVAMRKLCSQTFLRQSHSQDKGFGRPSFSRPNRNRQSDGFDRSESRRFDRGDGGDRKFDRGDRKFDRGDRSDRGERSDRGDRGFDRGDRGFDRGDRGFDRGDRGFDRNRRFNHGDRDHGFDRNRGFGRGFGRSDRGDRNRFNDRSRWDRSNSRFSRTAPREDDSGIVARNRHHERTKDDGLCGMPDYEVDREAVKTLKWEDLADKDIEAPAGMSNVRTQVLADRKLLSLPLVNSLVHNRKYEWLTPVQLRTLLPILKDESVVVRAKTGTGKTAAFAVPTIQKVLDAYKEGGQQNKVKAVIISPTRELAQQIADEVSKITNYGGLSHVSVQCFVGGLSKYAQLKEAGLSRPDSEGNFKRVCDIAVATPGRLQDILEDKNVLQAFDSLHFKVFDEADRLLDIGFDRILAGIRDTLASVSDPKKEIPLLLFSATADRSVREFAAAEFGDRVKLIDTIPKNEPGAQQLVEQHAVCCQTWADVYEGVTEKIVKNYEANSAEGKPFKAIVFMPTVAMVDHFEALVKACLPRNSQLRHDTMAIHGQKSQAQRQRRADKFRERDCAVLITTDVVARGMDFPHVTHVFQVGTATDLPSYIHRIGRTARAGNSGISYLYYTDHAREYLSVLRKQHICPNQAVFERDPEFHERFVKAADETADEEAFHALVNSLMSYMTVLKSKFRMDTREVMKDMKPFADLFGAENIVLSRSNRDVWDRAPAQRSRRFGSSRRGRMRW